MTKFGYKVLERNFVSLDEQNNAAWDELLAIQPLLAGCIACGACSAVCPRGVTHGMSVRKALIRTRRGQPVDLLPADCLMCNKCALVCPRNLNTRLVWFSLERMKEIK